MSDVSDFDGLETKVSHASVSETSLRQERVEHLQSVLTTLQFADEIAQHRYLINSSELADLMDVHASAVTSRGDEWVWRNWAVARVRREGNQILWQLKRIDA
jgi:ribonuclease HI